MTNRYVQPQKNNLRNFRLKNFIRFTWLILFVVLSFPTLWGQTTLFNDNFNTNNSATFSTTGAIGSYPNWSVTRIQPLLSQFAQAQPLKVAQICAPTLANKRLDFFASKPSKNLNAPAFKKNNENITQNPKPFMAYWSNVHVQKSNLTAI